MNRYRFQVPVPFRLEAVVRTHGWIELSPWRWEAGTLSRRERIGRSIGDLSIRQPDPGHVLVTWRGRDGALAPTRAAIQTAVARALSWDWDHAPFVAMAAGLAPEVGALVMGGAGRFIRGTSFYEGFAKTVLTINTTWASSRRMSENLVTQVGRGVFPTPKQVIAFGAAALKEEGRLGFRATTLFRSTERMLSDVVPDARGGGKEAALDYDYLMSLPAIGPYADTHCRIH